MRVALPGTDAAARCVEEDAVEFRLGWELVATIPCRRAAVENFGPGGALLELGQTTRRAIAGPEHALVLHEVGEVHGLAAFAGAGVPPSLAGLGCARVADELRSEVLDLELAALEFRG